MIEMRKPATVLIISPFFRPNIGGVETHLDDLCEYLRTHGFFTYVVTYQPLTTRAKGLPFERRGNLEIHRLSWLGCNLFHKFESYPLVEFLYLFPGLFFATFWFMVKNHPKIDVIHAHGLTASFITRLLINLFKKRFIASIHAVYEMVPNSIMARMAKWTLRGADLVLTLSNASKRELAKVGLDEDRIDTFTYWVNQKIFKPFGKAEARKEVGWEGKFIVLFVGRLIKIKGIHVLLEIAKQTTKDIYFAFIGDGPLSELISKSSKKLPNVLFIGKMDNRRLPLYYSAADLLCIPSQYEEGFGRVILESLSCGVPILGANRGGIPEAVDNTVGVLVDPTVGNLKKAIEHLSADTERLKKLGFSCRRYAEEKFSEKNAQAIVQAYS